MLTKQNKRCVGLWIFIGMELLKRLRFYIELINKHFPSLHTDNDDKYYEELLEMIDIYLYPHKYPKSKLHINQ